MEASFSVDEPGFGLHRKIAALRIRSFAPHLFV